MPKGIVRPNVAPVRPMEGAPQMLAPQLPSPLQHLSLPLHLTECETPSSSLPPETAPS